MNRSYYALILALLVILALRLWLTSDSQQRFPEDRTVTVTARLLSDPEQKGRNQSLVLKPLGYETLYVTAPLFPEYSYNQVLRVSGTVSHSDGEKIQFAGMRYPETTVQENDSLLYGLISFIRVNVSQLYQKALPSTGASLLMGIVFGIKQGMPQDFKDALSLTGVYHVVAASGMNVSLIAGAFMVFFGTFFRRQTALILSIGGIAFYAILAGLEPSIVRASIMGSIIFIAGILGRQNLALWSLGLTGYVMVLVDPSQIHDVGFQLSFLATLGILLISPVLTTSRSVMKPSESRGHPSNELVVISDLKTTIAAQLGTMPILLSAFGQVSLLSIPVNLLVLWTIPPLMFIGSIGAIAGMVFEPLGQLIVYLALPLLLYFEWVVMFFSSFDYALKIEDMPVWVSVVYYVVLFGGVWLVQRRRG